MDIFTKRVFSDSFRCAIQLTSKRFRGKLNLKRPRKPHFERAKVFEFAKPFYPSFFRDKTPAELCNKNKSYWQKDEIVNPYQQLIAKDLRQRFESSRLIGFFHMNPIRGGDRNRAVIMFKKQNMYFKNYGRKTVEMAIKDSPYEPALLMYETHNMTVFSPEPAINKMLAVAKKFPQLVLMAAIYEGKFINKDEILHYSTIPDLQTAQSILVQTLDSIGGNLVNQLTSSQNILVNQLNERLKQLEIDTKENK